MGEPRRARITLRPSAGRTSPSPRGGTSIPPGVDFKATRERYRDRMSRSRKLDIAIAGITFAAAVTVMYQHGFGTADPDVHDGDALGVALVALMTMPLTFRRDHPLAVFVVSAAATVGIHAIGYPGELGLVPALAVYSLAAYASDSRAARIGGLIAGGTFVLLGAIALVADPDPGIVAGAVAWAGAWVAGDQARQRRLRVATLEDRTQRERRLAAVEERNRMARELHDSAGHALNVILVQAGAARLLRERDPERATEALETIESVAHSTLGEIDRLVRGLREDEPEEGASRAPLPGMASIDDLADSLRAAGLTVTTRVQGAPRRLQSPVDLAAYRIVQEALTNAARHGRGSAELVLKYGPEALDIQVVNPIGRNGATRRDGGHGLVGMRERAALCGGTLKANGENGLFRVRASLPYEGGVA
jgi:signal transduction histidine kinase